jgi:hypothetical protein
MFIQMVFSYPKLTGGNHVYLAKPKSSRKPKAISRRILQTKRFQTMNWKISLKTASDDSRSIGLAEG